MQLVLNHILHHRYDTKLARVQQAVQMGDGIQSDLDFGISHLQRGTFGSLIDIRDSQPKLIANVQAFPLSWQVCEV